MAALSAGSITYTIKNMRRMGNSRVQNRVSLAFGDSTLTYPTGGITLSAGNLGCAGGVVESVVVVDGGTSGYEFNYSASSGKLLIYSSASHNHSIFVAAGGTDAASTRTNIVSTLGVAASSAFTVGGVTVATGAVGGVVTAQPSLSLTELPTTAQPAALTLIVEVIGW